MMKREELKEKMENVKVWVCNHKKVVGTAAAAVLTIAVVGVAVYAVNAPVGADKAVAKVEQKRETQKEEKKAEEKKDAEEKKQEKEKSGKEKEKKQEKKTDNAKSKAAKQIKENTATSSTVTNSGSAFGSPEPAPSQPQSNQPESSSQPSKQEQPAQPQPSQPSQEKPAESKPAPEPEKPAHVHDWQPQYKDGQKWVDDSWDEPIYETKVVCGCGEVFDDELAWGDHQMAGCTLGYSVQEVQTGTEHHSEGHYEPTQELTGYKCSCGATK